METLQTLDRGLAALRLLAQAEKGLKIAELARELGVARTIAYRIAATLEANGMAIRLSDGRIGLGSGAIALGTHSDRVLRMQARPIADALAEELGATAFLSVADRDEGVAILIAEPRNAFLNIQYRIGTRHPLTQGAAGIAILAGRTAQSGEPDAVRQARAEGYSLTRGQLQPGAVGVASPVPLSYPGMECSLGVVALEGLDEEAAIAAVQTAAAKLADLMRSPG